MNKNYLRDLGGGTSSGLLATRANYAPDHPAVAFEGTELTYRELDDGASSVAAGLLTMGLRPGDAVSVFLSNRLEYLPAVFGISRAGMRYVPVNTAFKGSFLEYALDHSDSRALITESRLGDPLADLTVLPSNLAHVVYLGGQPERLPRGDIATYAWDDVIAKSEVQVDFPELRPDDISAITYTSGTTGRSKGVLAPALQGVIMARETAAVMDTTTRDRLYTCLPLFHGAAMTAACMHAIYAGATICLSPKFSASRFWDEIRDSGATQFNALGSMIPMLLAQPPSDRDREHDVERVFAAPAPPEILHRFEARFGVHIVEGYGVSEIKNVIYNPLVGRKVGSLGLPTPSSIIQIHDDLGEQVSPGEVGEIVYRPKMAHIMFKGYHKDPEATLATMDDLWWHTGDLGYVDHDGFFYFTDRKKDALRRRGENISSQEVEAALMLYPGVHEAAAVAVHSDLGEDEVMAVLEVSDPHGFDLEALFRHCDSTMPHFMVPRYYKIAVSMPRTPTGKIRKVALREDGVADDTWDAHAAGLRTTRNL
ncbi:AMP-binding protein [Rhodococcus sp. G-MC3]|uniref:AMP-binding protein n=1 Tax=Rhodococcus sp. G-MC3 TaxID=3046209 RepID=UPI0024B9D82C|nr:AMP-binding protein [Rhodococcus sp. G-MC3]MDJ0396571.1 AMP-binding protein [Rhodococcus sp. G-MC3]